MTAARFPQTVNPPAAPLTPAAWVACALWVGYLLLSPFYLFESGMPQLADFLLVVLTAWLTVVRGLSLSSASRGIVASAGALVAYIVVVNGAWTILVSDTSLMLYAAFYLFNIVALIDTAVMFHWLGRRFGEITGLAAMASVLLQAALSLAMGGAGGARETMFFNNPNQLGYYVVLFASLFWAWSQATRRSRVTVLWLEAALYGASAWLAIGSSSRAAIGALAILVLLRAALRANVVFLGLVALAGFLAITSDHPIFDPIKARMERKTQDTSAELSYRGYDRMQNHPQYLVLGAGEGAYWRFISDHHGELHSTFGSLLFCYGAVGLLLFLRMFWIVFRDAGWRAAVYLAPVSAYGMSHNGLRQSELWILFALVVCLFSRRAVGSSSPTASLRNRTPPSRRASIGRSSSSGAGNGRAFPSGGSTATGRMPQSALADLSLPPASAGGDVKSGCAFSRIKPAEIASITRPSLFQVRSSSPSASQSTSYGPTVPTPVDTRRPR